MMETKKLIKTNPEYENRNYYIRKLFWNRVKTALEFSDIRKNHKNIILDIGCGRAKLFHLINKISPTAKMIGIDINEDITKLKIKNASFIVIKLNEQLPFKEEYFDEIFALDCLEHIDKLEFELNQIKRVLKNNGSLIISGPTENILYKLGRFIMKGTWNEVYEDGEKHSWNIFQIKKKILKNGYIVKKSKILPSRLLPLFAIYKFKKI